MAPRPKKTNEEKETTTTKTKADGGFALATALPITSALPLLLSLSLSFFWGSICIRNEHVKSISIFQMETAAATISNQTAQTAQARPFSRSDRGSGSSSIGCARSDRGSGSGSRVTESAGLVRKRMRCALWTN